MGKFKVLNLNTKEIALVSIFSAVWVAAQIYAGPVIGQITQIHGVTQRLVGWLLMLILAELTGKFGRVTTMSAVAALATRVIRRSASLYIWVVGLGYALGGLTFDFLFFLPRVSNFTGKTRKLYLLTISFVSGVVAVVPYVLFRFFTFFFSSELQAFIIWIPFYVPRAVPDIILNVLGTFVGLSILRLLKPWSTSIKQQKPRFSIIQCLSEQLSSHRLSACCTIRKPLFRCLHPQPTLYRFSKC